MYFLANKLSFWSGFCALVDMKNCDVYQMLLLYYNSPVNAADHEGNTGLHIACLKGHYHVVNALLYQQGAEPLNVNAQNIQQETPLLIAAKFGYS